MKKIINKDKFKNIIRPKLKNEKKRIALCHGVFDLVHPGHIIHLEQAKSMADVLVVSITAAQYVRKGLGRPYFDDSMRLKVLAALECVDYVMLSEGYTVDDIIESVKPDYYIKGEEYSVDADDITGKIVDERMMVEKYGGRLVFTTGQTFSSTKLINTAMSGLPDEIHYYMKNFKNEHSMTEIRTYVEKALEAKVLVLGDFIIDRYTYCIVQGLMSKDMGYSARMLSSEDYLGGAAAVARHLSGFSNHVTLMSIIGNEERVCQKIENELSDKMSLELFHSKIIPTIVKQRYLTKNQKREEYKKIFAINNISQNAEYETEIEEAFLRKLDNTIRNYDIVFLCDFGHGLVNQKIINLVQEKARYLVLNCQTNSTNKGLNIITKYTKADVFTLDQEELKLAFPMFVNDENEGLKALSKHLDCDGWLTRGSAGAWQILAGQINICPAFTLSVKDTVGAGDAFYAVAGIMRGVGAPMEVGTVMGNIAGALGANIVGNKERVEKVNVLKYASTLMNV